MLYVGEGFVYIFIFLFLNFNLKYVLLKKKKLEKNWIWYIKIFEWNNLL